ncbi:g9973 [Coccomyxa elongata]
MAFAAFKISQVTWTQENPKEFKSSPRARRLFCGTCGSQLGMQYDESEDIIYLPITSLDNPDTAPPQRHIYWPEHRSWLQLADTLPRHAKGTIED